MKRFKNLLVIFITAATLLNACKKDETPSIPVLPSDESFNMEFDNFNEIKSTGALVRNWTYSVLCVSFFNTKAASTMVIPTIAFNKSFEQTPTYIGDQTWQWSYSFEGHGGVYHAKLNGITLKNNDVKWEMYIDWSGINAYSNFLLFEGTTTSDNKKASWSVYVNPSSPTALFDIQWQTEGAEAGSELKYTYKDKGSNRSNSSIVYKKKPGENFDRAYSILFTEDNSNINIEWNALARDGRVSSPTFYKDDIWHCWNNQLIDDWCE